MRVCSRNLSNQHKEKPAASDGFTFKLETNLRRFSSDPHRLIAAHAALGGLLLFLLQGFRFEKVFAETEETEGVADHEHIGDEVKERCESDTE